MDSFIPELQNHIYASEGFSATIMSNPRHRRKEEYFGDSPPNPKPETRNFETYKNTYARGG